MSKTQQGNPIIGGMIVKFGQMVISGECGLDDDEINELVELMGSKKLTLEQASDYLNMDRSTLTRKIRDEILPQPRKDKGGKKYFFKKDLKQ